MTDHIDTDTERGKLATLVGLTPGPWVGANMVHADHGGLMKPEEIAEYICKCVKVGDPNRFLFVSGKHDDGGGADICHTGNGPRGPANTRLIAAAPDLLSTAHRLLDALDVRDAEIERLRRNCEYLHRAVETTVTAGADLLTRAEGALQRVVDEVTPKILTDAQVYDACLSDRHDFGLLEGDERDAVKYRRREGWRSIRIALNRPEAGHES